MKRFAWNYIWMMKKIYVGCCAHHDILWGLKNLSAVPETKNWKLWVFLGTTQQLPSDKAFRGGSNVGSVRPGPWLIKPNYKTKTSFAGPITRMNATDH